MFFISSLKLFSFLISLHFCPDVFGYVGKRLDQKATVRFQNLWRHLLEYKQLQDNSRIARYNNCQISQEVKAIDNKIWSVSII